MSGTIDDNPLSNSATTLNSTELAGLEAIDSTEHAVLVLDPTGAGNGPEVVYVTAHTGSATSATVVRGREGTSGVQHSSVMTWVHVPTVNDYIQTLNQANLPSSGGLPYEGQRVMVVDEDREKTYTGSTWDRSGWYSSSGRTGGQWRRNAAQSIANGAAVAISFDAEDADSDAFCTPTASTVTIPAALGGLYLAQYDVTWDANATQVKRTWISVNDTALTTEPSNDLKGLSTAQPVDTFGNDVSLNGMAVFRLAPADVVRLMVSQSAGSHSVNKALFQLWRLGA